MEEWYSCSQKWKTLGNFQVLTGALHLTQCSHILWVKLTRKTLSSVSLDGQEMDTLFQFFFIKKVIMSHCWIQGPAVADAKEDTPKNWTFCFGLKRWEKKDMRKPDNYTTGIVVQRADNPAYHQTEWIHDYKEKIVSDCAHELVRIKNEDDKLHRHHDHYRPIFVALRR